MKKAKKIIWIPITIFFFAIIVVIMLLVSGSIRERQYNDTLVLDLVGEFKVHLSLFHLWLEEYIAGDRSKGKGVIWLHFEDAKSRTAMILNGGKTAHGILRVTKREPHTREVITSIRENLDRLSKSANRRLNDLSNSAVGSTIDKEFDAIFASIFDEIIELESYLRYKQYSYLKNSRRLMHFIIAAWVAAITLIFLILYLMMRRRIAAVQAISESEAKYRRLAEGLKDAVYIADPVSRRITYINKAAEDIFGYTASEIIDDPGLCKNMILKEDRQRVLQEMKDAINAVESADIIYRITRRDSQERWMRNHLSVETDATGEVVSIHGICYDITERIHAEQEIIFQKNKVDKIVTGIGAGLTLLDLDLHVLWFNDKLKEWFDGLIIDNQRHCQRYYGLKDPETECAALRAIQSGKVEKTERYVELKDGSKRFFQIICAPVEDSEGRIAQIVELTLDLTDHKKAEEGLVRSLNEKEVLLKEVHHRVKNNLQLISGLLKLQSIELAGNKVKSAKEALEESRDRVKSMALVHDRLYQTGDLAYVDFFDCINAIKDDLASTYNTQDRIKIRLTGAHLHLGVNQAIPAALIVAELLTNTMKYAFPGTDGGVVDISLLERGDDVELTVSDNGVGLNAYTDWRHSATMGLKLVNGLVGQLGGHIELDNSNGTLFKITFRKD